MRRVVVTGMGIISSIGNSLDEVTASLRAAKPGIVFAEDYAELGFRSQVKGDPRLDPFEILDRRVTRFMGKGAAWNYLAMQQAIADAGLEESDISNPMTGIVMGSGGASTRTIVEAADITRKNNSPKRIGPLAVPKAMGSTASATLATPFGIKGINYTITAACATSKHCIGNGLLHGEVVPGRALAHETGDAAVEDFERIEARIALDLAAEAQFGIVGRRDNAGSGGTQACGHLVQRIADRGNDTHAGYDNSSHRVLALSSCSGALGAGASLYGSDRPADKAAQALFWASVNRPTRKSFAS